MLHAGGEGGRKQARQVRWELAGARGSPQSEAQAVTACPAFHTSRCSEPVEEFGASTTRRSWPQCPVL